MSHPVISADTRKGNRELREDAPGFDKHNRRRNRCTHSAIAHLLIAATLAGCAINPVTGDRELALISEDQEIAMGRDAAQQVSSSLGLVENAALQQYVSGVGLELARTSERPDLPWEFHVVDDPTPNAFALPGGYIYVTRGLLTLMNSEAELAAVLGHEIGHVTARHSVSQLSQAQLAQLALGIGMIASPELRQFGELANTGLSLLFLKFGRDDERQADELGFQYMLAHQYDVREMRDVFVALQSSGELAGQSPIPSWLASHPGPPDRIAAVQERISALETPQQAVKINARSYLERLDGVVYGSDPRHGFFEDGYFYHPELAFQFLVPESWRKQNLTAAVLAISPNQDAALQLTLTQGDAAQGALSFFEESGAVAIESPESTEINGHEAMVSRFQAETPNGAVRGLAAHIEFGEVTYRLVTFAPMGAYQSQETLFRQIIGSFSPATDRDVLDVQARRLQIIELDRDMTLSEFEKDYPSTDLSIEELAVINQVEGPSSTLKGGAAAKRVIG